MRRFDCQLLSAVLACVATVALASCATTPASSKTETAATRASAAKLPPPPADTPFHEAEFIFPPEDFHNHSSSIVETPEGDLIACWFHGKGERTDDTLVISGARKNKGETAWSPTFVMADNQNLPDQNCTMFIDPQGRLWLFWISAIDNLVRSYFPMYRYSDDYEGDGPPVWDWQEPLFVRPKNAETAFIQNIEQRLVDMQNNTEVNGERRQRFMENIEERKKVAQDKLFQRLGWMPRQPPIMLTQTRMMVPLYSDTFGCSLFAYTENGGEDWEYSPPMFLPGGGNIQASLVRKQNGNIVAFMRSNGRVRQIRRAESSDGGMSWTEVPLDIPNGGSSVAACGLRSGNWVLLCNDTVRGRHILTAYLSDDEGQTWKWKRALENLEPEKGTGSYPTVIQGKDGTIHCTYTHEDAKNFAGKTIKHARFNEAWVKAGAQ